MIGYIIAAIIGGVASIFLYAIVSAGRINEERSEAYWKGFTDGVQAQRKVETMITTASVITDGSILIPWEEIK